LAGLLASRFALCVVVFHVYASGDARWCARRLACRKLVPFCSFKIVVAIFVVLVSMRCVLWCVGWVEGAVGWFGGGPTCRVLNWFVFFCSVTCSVLVLVFV